MFWFVLAIVFSDLLFIPLMLRFPIDRSEPVPFSVFLQSFKCSWLGHLLCVLGGVIWAFGFLCYVLSASSCSMNNATSYAIGQCAPLAAIFWGALLWKEFNGCRRIVWIYLIASVAFYIGAVVLAAISRETSDDACNISITTPIPTMWSFRSSYHLPSVYLTHRVDEKIVHIFTVQYPTTYFLTSHRFIVQLHFSLHNLHQHLILSSQSWLPFSIENIRYQWSLETLLFFP